MQSQRRAHTASRSRLARREIVCALTLAVRARLVAGLATTCATGSKRHNQFVATRTDGRKTRDVNRSANFLLRGVLGMLAGVRHAACPRRVLAPTSVRDLAPTSVRRIAPTRDSSLHRRTHRPYTFSASASATASTWPFTFTLSQRWTTFPSGPMRYVVRAMPMYLRP